MTLLRPPRPEDAAGLVALVTAISEHEGDPVGAFDEAVALREVIAPEGPVSCLVAEEAGALGAPPYT